MSILVVGGEQPEGAVSDKAQVRVTDETRVFAADGSAAKLEDLSVGAQVKVWFVGAVAESYPVQGTAEVIQFVE